MCNVQAEMPRYRSHKVVHAFKIAELDFVDAHTIWLTPADQGYAKFNPGSEWVGRFKGSREDMGYYVVYEDGYTSWSPTKAFEDGYTRI
jgi:hypothetical protein